MCVAKLPDPPTKMHGACQFCLHLCLFGHRCFFNKSVFQFEKDGIRESLMASANVNLFLFSHIRFGELVNILESRVFFLRF